MIEPRLIAQGYDFDDHIIDLVRTTDFFIEEDHPDFYPCLAIVIGDTIYRSVMYDGTDSKHSFFYYVGNIVQYISREEFISAVQDGRPECFDWLLFHPEWL